MGNHCKGGEPVRYTKFSYWVVLLNPVFLLVWGMGVRALYRLCLLGGLRSHGPMILACGTLEILWTILWTFLYFRGKKRQERRGEERFKKGRISIFLALILTVQTVALLGLTAYYGAKIAEAAVPYHGALSWKLDELKRSRKVTLKHDHVFESGVKGVFEDLEEEIDLPDQLYFRNPFVLKFDRQGKIEQMEGFFYGRTQDGEDHTYLLDYSGVSGEKMTVWLDGYAKKEYAQSEWMTPMFELMEMVDLRSIADSLAEGMEQVDFVLTYQGYEKVADMEKAIVYRQDGEVAADGKETITDAYQVILQAQMNENVIDQMALVNGFRVSDTTRTEEAEEKEQDISKQIGSCFMDWTDESWYFYLNEEKGWRLRVHDAALGSRWYVMDVTGDGGNTWETLNENPFDSQMGVVQGMKFYDEQYGYYSIGGASGSASWIFVTRDGGMTSAKLELPWDQVTGASKSSEQYPYLSMPEETKEGLEICASADSSGQGEALVFVSVDQGNTWIFQGIREK